MVHSQNMGRNVIRVPKLFSSSTSNSKGFRDQQIVQVTVLHKSKLFDLDFADYMVLKQAGENLDPFDKKNKQVITFYARVEVADNDLDHNECQFNFNFIQSCQEREAITIANASPETDCASEDFIVHFSSRDKII
jgi:hypothetical protein